MDLQEGCNCFGTLHASMSRNVSSSSSVFFSANHSPFFSPRSSTCQSSETISSDIKCDRTNLNNEPIICSSGIQDSQLPTLVKFILEEAPRISVSCAPADSQKFDNISPSTCISNSTPSSSNTNHVHNYFGPTRKQNNYGRRKGTSFTTTSASLTSRRMRSCDVFIAFHGRSRSLIRFVNWLCADLEMQGMSCFVSDRSRCRNSRKRVIIERAMDAASFGVVILTRKSFTNPYTIEELRFFSSMKNLVPIYFDLGPGDCLVRDIVERRGEMWEKHGGELWFMYGGVEREWKQALEALSRVDEWKLEAQDGNWRDCIVRAVTLIAMRLGRRSVADRMSRWKEKVEKDEFPFPRNENFIGRKKELSDLEFMLFGDVGRESERDYFELKARPVRKNVIIGSSRSNSAEEKFRKGKEPVVWKDSGKEIEMQNSQFPKVQRQLSRPKSRARCKRRSKSMKVLYGKGAACVSGESGIGKTELLLEFAYRFRQRYKMVLWIGGESRYIRQNYLNLWSFLDVDVGIDNCPGKSRIQSFEEQEEAAVFRVRKELMKNIPFLVIIDNLESEKDWWDHELIMDLLPRFGGETHLIVSTHLPKILNLEPLKLSYLSGIEALSLMQGGIKDYPLAEVDALRAIEEKLGRLTLGLAIVGAILSELPINPSRLFHTINRMPLGDFTWSGTESHLLRQNTFFLRLLEVCFSIFDHADGPRSLVTKMVQAGGWFAPAGIPVSLLALAANRIPEKHQSSQLWNKVLHSLTCGLSSSYTKKSEVEAASMLLRFNIARSCTKQSYLYFNDLIRLYGRRRHVTGVAHATVQAVISRGSVLYHFEHLWAACFLIFGFRNDPKVVELKVSELVALVKDVVLPLAVRTFITFSRCSAASELLRLCTDALEAADQAFVTPVEKWVDKSLCWRPAQTNAQLNPCLWEELALTRATVLETRAKLMLRGGLFDIGDDLIRKAIFIRSSICGEDHLATISARETLSKFTRLLANVQTHTSP